MSSEEKNIELLKKLKRLAEEGVGGEKGNAQVLLSRLMEKYNVTEIDLSDDALEEHGFEFRNQYERKLLHQLISKIADDRECYRYMHGRGARSMLYLKCTKAEAVQMEVEYDFYRALWAEEMDWLFRAFVSKHRIFDTKPGHKTDEISDEDYLRLCAMMAGLQSRSLHPQIEGR